MTLTILSEEEEKIHLENYSNPVSEMLIKHYMSYIVTDVSKTLQQPSRKKN